MFSVPDLFLFAFGLSVVNSFSHYQTLIPNGQHVPSPCKNDERWIGVGHRNPAGGGARNQFGLDFASNDHVSGFLFMPSRGPTVDRRRHVLGLSVRQSNRDS